MRNKFVFRLYSSLQNFLASADKILFVKNYHLLQSHVMITICYILSFEHSSQCLELKKYKWIWPIHFYWCCLRSPILFMIYTSWNLLRFHSLYNSASRSVASFGFLKFFWVGYPTTS